MENESCGVSITSHWMHTCTASGWLQPTAVQLYIIVVERHFLFSLLFMSCES